MTRGMTFSLSAWRLIPLEMRDWELRLYGKGRDEFT